MPAIKSPGYKGSILSINKHFETIYPALFRKVNNPPTVRRQRLELEDGDFLDLDLATLEATLPNKKVVIITHGLEGDSSRPYIKGMSKAFFNHGWDVLAWNLRGCSEEMNRLPRFYNSGATEDLDAVVAEAVRRGYEQISLVGFSLGGNITVKYLGEPMSKKRPIVSSVAISVPLDLESCSVEIDKWHNYLYTERFLRTLVKKIKLKAKVFPHAFELPKIKKIKSIFEFDEIVTGPLHGYAGAVDYYTRCSSAQFVPTITTPTLVINALNDTFLSEKCYDEAPFASNPNTLLLKPTYGGHCGFAEFSDQKTYWSEQVATEFCLDPQKWLQFQ